MSAHRAPMSDASAVRRGPGAFADLKPGDSGEPMDVVEEHDGFGTV